MNTPSFAPRFVAPMLTSLFVLALLSSSGYSQNDTLVDVFPLSIGNQWTYRYFTLLEYSPTGIPIETRTDSGRATYNVSGSVTNTDSTRWQFRLTRDLKRRQMFYNPVTHDTTYPIRDTSHFELIENHQGQHQLFRNEGPHSIHLDVFPFTKNFTDTTRIFRFRTVGEGDTASFKSRLVNSGVRSTFTVKRATGLLRFKYNSGTFDVFDSAYHYLLNSVITSLAETKTRDLPERYGLSQNYPNPFNPTTNIRFQIAEYGFVSLKVFDMLGREVATLVNEEMRAGTYERTFDGSRFASGVYVYRLQTGSVIISKKLLLLK